MNRFGGDIVPAIDRPLTAFVEIYASKGSWRMVLKNRIFTRFSGLAIRKKLPEEHGSGEKKWVMLKDSTVRVYKWVPVSESQRFGSTVTAEEITLKPADTNDLSQDSSEQQSEAEEGLDSDVRTLSNFAETNDDSNAFSEGCFNSDSNQALSNDATSAAESGATDFRELMNDVTEPLGKRPVNEDDGIEETTATKQSRCL